MAYPPSWPDGQGKERDKMKVSGWQNVRDYMLDGWQLGFDGHGGRGWWLQKGGLGRGGESLEVHAATGWKLRKEEIVIATNTEDTPWYRTDYVLAEIEEA